LIHLKLKAAEYGDKSMYDVAPKYTRFGLTDNLMCPCEEEEQQTSDHLIFQCKKLRNQGMK